MIGLETIRRRVEEPRRHSRLISSRSVRNAALLSTWSASCSARASRNASSSVWWRWRGKC